MSTTTSPTLRPAAPVNEQALQAILRCWLGRVDDDAFDVYGSIADQLTPANWPDPGLFIARAALVAGVRLTLATLADPLSPTTGEEIQRIVDHGRDDAEAYLEENHCYVFDGMLGASK